MTDVGKEIVNALENIGGWEQSSCTIDNDILELSIWTENTPFLSTHVYRPIGVVLSFHDKWCIYQAIKKCNVKMLINKIKSVDETRNKDGN